MGGGVDLQARQCRLGGFSQIAHRNLAGAFDASYIVFEQRAEFRALDFDKIKKHFISLGNWKYYETKIHHYKTSSISILTDIKLAQFLHSLDFREKSYKSPSKLLDLIPEKLHSYFWRGYFDGDGCFTFTGKYHRRFFITSSYEQDWLDFENLMKRLNIQKYRISKVIDTSKSKDKPSKCSRCGSSNKEDIKKFFNYIYQNYDKDKIGLSRKHDKFKEWFKLTDLN